MLDMQPTCYKARSGALPGEVPSQLEILQSNVKYDILKTTWYFR